MGATMSTTSTTSPGSLINITGNKFKLNPGTYEDLSKKCKDLFPQPIEGFTVVVSHPLNQYLEMSHALSRSTGYRAWSSYKSPNDETPDLMLFTGMDITGTLHTQGSYRLNDYVKARIAVQLRKSRYARSDIRCGVDIRGKDCTSSITLINPDLVTLKGKGVFSHLHAVNPKLCVGMEVMHQNQSRASSTTLTVSGRYSTDDTIQTVSVSNEKVIGATYYRWLSKEMQIGFEAEKDFRLMWRPTHLSGALNIHLQDMDFTMKTMIDNQWTVTGVLEKRLLVLPAPIIVSVCGSGNHVKKQFQVGCNVTVEA